MASHICSGCIEDIFLKAAVDKEGLPAKCDACGVGQQKSITISRLGEILEPILRELLALGDEVRRFSSEDDENGHLEQEGDDLDYFVQEILGQYFDFNDEIVEAVIDAEGCWPPDGDEAFFSTAHSYVRLYASDQNHATIWRHLDKEIRQTRRFFSFKVKDFFDELFSDIETQLTYTERTRDDGILVHFLPAGSPFYRSRICDSDGLRKKMIEQPYKHVGPPPQGSARAGRMNADGVSLFYGARELKTCLAELRPALRVETGTITVETTKPLRVLDFTRFENAKKSLSYFQPDYKQQAARFAFLRQLGNLISRPVIPGHEAEYFITQAMTEYLAHEHSNPFDGLFYPSAQRAEGTNVVLFPQPTPKGIKFPAKYKDGSIVFHRTSQIEYKHDELAPRIGAKGPEPDWEWWESQD